VNANLGLKSFALHEVETEQKTVATATGDYSFLRAKLIFKRQPEA
jgi:hypothetical protein